MREMWHTGKGNEDKPVVCAGYAAELMSKMGTEWRGWTKKLSCLEKIELNMKLRARLKFIREERRKVGVMSGVCLEARNRISRKKGARCKEKHWDSWEDWHPGTKLWFHVQVRGAIGEFWKEEKFLKICAIIWIMENLGPVNGRT